MSKLYRLSCIFLIVLVSGCSKSDDASHHVFIRIRNTSLLNFRDVEIDPGFNNKAKHTGPIEAGKTTEYLDFARTQESFGVLVQMTEYRGIGYSLMMPAVGEPQELAPGRYTVELFIPNTNGEIELTLKVMKD